MMTEILRMEEASIRGNGGIEVHNINLMICAGACMGLAGVSGSKETLAEFLRGNGVLTEGNVFINGHCMNRYDRRDFEDQGIFVISSDVSYMESLDVSENIFLLRRNSLKKIVLNERALHIQGQHYLDRYRLPLRADQDSSLLKMSDKIMIAVIRAITQGAKLIVLYHIGGAFQGEDREALVQLLIRLKEEGIAVMIADNRAGYDNAVYDEIDIFRHHTITKKLFDRQDFDMVGEILQSGLDSTVYKNETDSRTGDAVRMELFYRQEALLKPMLTVHAGEILAVMADTQVTSAIWNMLINGGRQSDLLVVLDGSHLRTNSPHSLLQHRVALLSCGEETEICRNLSNEENILLPSYKRISDRFGFYEKPVRYIMRDTFLGQKRNEIRMINRDSEGWKLAVYRWKLFHPRVFLLKNVLSDLDVKDRAWIKTELSMMAQRGTAVILFESEAEVCRDIADRIEVIG